MALTGQPLAASKTRRSSALEDGWDRTTDTGPSTRNTPGAAAARGKINGCVSVEDFDEVFDELLACAREHAAAHE